MGESYVPVALVVWRECVEALLIVGILNAWLGHRADRGLVSVGCRFLWSGVAAGLVAAVLLGAILLFFAQWLEGDREDYFQLLMVFVAAMLILQMVVWMRAQGRGMRGDLERRAERTIANGWGLAVLAASAVLREGSETVVFVYGILASATGATVWQTAAAVLSGLAAGAGSYALLQLGARRFPWALFFQVTQTILFFLAAALIMAGLDRAIGLGLVSPLSLPLWDSAWLLDDGSGTGSLLAGLTGYRARPELLPLLVYGSYWLGVVLLLWPRHAARGQVA